MIREYRSGKLAQPIKSTIQSTLQLNKQICYQRRI